jgi:hypothetical protein
MGEADVYAGDLDLLRGLQEVAGNFMVLVQADAYPDVLARIANVLLLTNTAPRDVLLHTDAGGQVSVQIVILDIVPDVARRVATKLRQLIMVTDVRVETLTESIDP